LIFLEEEELKVATRKISKLKAAMALCDIPIKKGDIVLYLGASHGITAELLSDLVGPRGFVFCLEFAPEVVKYLISVCEKYSNMCPLFFDASFPEKYKQNVSGVNVIYQDIAQRNQVDILIRNAELFLKKGDYAFLCLKLKAIDSVASEDVVLKQAVKKLSSCFDIVKVVDISSTHKGHRFVVLKKI